MPKLSDAAWVSVRAEFERSPRPLREIADSAGIHHTTLWRRAVREKWLRPDDTPPIPEGPADAKLLGRLFRTFERQVTELEQRFTGGGDSIEEKDARTLSVLARTFQTLAKLRDDRDSEVIDAPVDLDALRARLADRLAALGPPRLAAGGTDAGPGEGPDGS